MQGFICRSSILRPPGFTRNRNTAMSIGSVLAGAGLVGQGMREAQADVRAARFEQLKMEEANRLQQIMNEAEQMYGADTAPKNTFRPGLQVDIATAPPSGKSAPTAQTAVPSGAGVAVTTTGARASTAAAPTSKTPPSAKPTPSTKTPAAATPAAAKIDAETGLPLPTGALTPEETARLNELRNLRAVETAVTFRAPHVGSLLTLGSLPTPQRQALINQTKAEYEALLAKESAYSKAAQAFEAQAEPIRRTQRASREAGIPLSPTPPVAAETPAAAETPVAAETPATPKVKAGVATEQPAAPVGATASVSASTQVISPAVRQAAISADPAMEEVFTAADFYLTDPNRVPYEVQQAMDQRNELARLAGLMLRSRSAQGFQSFLQLKSQINAIDSNILELQGMQGIADVVNFRDPRRLAGVLSIKSGGQLAIQPRTDGHYNVVPIVNGKPAGTPIAEGLSADELSVYAMKIFSPAYRQKAVDVAAGRAEKAFEAQLEAEIERIKAAGDFSAAQISALAKLKAAMISAGGRVNAAAIGAAADAGLKLVSDSNTGAMYAYYKDGQIFRLTPEQPLPDGGQTLPTFNPIPVVGRPSSGSPLAFEGY